MKHVYLRLVTIVTFSPKLLFGPKKQIGPTNLWIYLCKFECFFLFFFGHLNKICNLHKLLWILVEILETDQCFWIQTRKIPNIDGVQHQIWIYDLIFFFPFEDVICDNVICVWFSFATRNVRNDTNGSLNQLLNYTNTINSK